MNSEPRHPVQKVFAVLGSLRLTVALLGMSIFLVFVGTLAQVNNGIWTVMEQYFRCWIATLGGWFPFPGGKLLGAALLINLIVSHTARIRVQARGGRALLGLATIVVGVASTWLVISHAFDLDSTQKTIDPSMRVTLQLMQGGGIAAVLFVGCWLLYRRKAGIVLLHSGIMILMFSELYTGELAEEGTMSIFEGQSVNYVEDNRSSELAIIDDSGAAADDVVVVPEKLLKRGGAIRLEGMPFDLEVDREKFFKNAQLAPIKAGDPNPATMAAGLRIKAEARREEAGVDSSGRVDLPAAYVTFKDRGTNVPIGTLMTSVRYTVEKGAQTVRAGSKEYRVSLRFKRTYKPVFRLPVEVPVRALSGHRQAEGLFELRPGGRPRAGPSCATSASG
jgi:hypothetical protein